jgi:hypothetical protein
MGTPYSLASATFDDYLAISSEDSAAFKFDVSQDGTKIYVFGQNNDKIFRYSMTAWDISSASFDTGQELSTASTDTDTTGVVISADGTMLLTLGNTSTESVYRYAMSSAYDLTTASPDGHVFDITGFSASPNDLNFSQSGRRMHIVEDTNDVVNMWYTGHIVAPEDA